jgi:Cu(I)/Ag(I) efflux system membrane protein CusA/SilA
MSGRVVAWCSRHHWIVIASALVLALAGELGRRSLSRDVIPDLSEPQIVLVADWMGHPAAEVAGKVTKVITGALDGIPGSTAVRGSTMSGMAYVDVVFDSIASLEKGRNSIVERAASLRRTLPETVRLQVGPLASSTGWVFQYALVDPSHEASQSKLRRFQDEVLAPALASIRGVAEVASVGGGVSQVNVETNSEELRLRGIAFSDVVSRLRSDLRGRKATSIEELEGIPVTGAPDVVRVGDVARVRFGSDMPSGLADLDGVYQAVGGIVIARRDANIGAVVEAAQRTLEREATRLSPDLRVVTVYDRQDLIDRVGKTLLRALAEEVGVVVLVVLVFLLHARSALVPLCTLPLVLCMTFGAMWLLGVPATIMSVGGIGIALGMAVDADVVALEACHRHLEGLGADSSREERRAKRLAAAASLTPAILTSLLITAITFLPVFGFTGETGRLLRPLALTKTLVIASAAIVSLTLAPALRDRLLAGRIKPEFDNSLTRWLVRIYRPFVQFALARPVLTLATAGLAVVSCLPILPSLGGEFLPRVDEGDLLFMPTTLPGAHPDDVAGQLRRQDAAIAKFKGVATVFGKVGRADTATDPAPYSMAETTIRLRPRSEWPKLPRQRWYSSWAPSWAKPVLGKLWPEQRPLTTPELIDRLDSVSRMPGWTHAWTAPARARMDMMSTGIHTPVGVRITAWDATRLDTLGEQIRTLVSALPGTRSAVFESIGAEPWPAFEPDAAALARHQVDAEVARTTADSIVTGGQVGEVEVDGARMRVRVMSDTQRGLTDRIREATVRSAGSGRPVALALVGRTSMATQPAALRAEHGELAAYVYIDLKDGVDLLGFVEDAQRELGEAVATKRIELDRSERIEWTGQYDLLAAGQRRLAWIVPIVALSMIVLLFLQFRNMTEALIVLISVPFALVGSVWTLFLSGYTLSAPVWVGLLSVVGLAMQTGVVMVVYIDEAFHRRVREGKLATRDDIVAAHAEGTILRLRPKIMTVTTMAAALLPLVWSEGAGAEIMKRVAAPMLGGLVTSAFLTLEVLPVVYTIWRHRQLKRAQRLGIPIDQVVGTVPSWARE